MPLFQKYREKESDLVAVTRRDLTELIGLAVTGARVSFTSKNISGLTSALNIFRRYLSEMAPKARNEMLSGIRIFAQMDLASAGRDDSYTDPEVSKAWIEFADTPIDSNAAGHSSK